VNFEKVKLEDIDEMLKIEKKSFHSHWSRQTFIDEFSADNGHYVAIKDGGRILGYSGFRYVLDEGHITTLAVSPKFRKKGIGTKLIAQLIEDAKVKGLKKLYLEVRQSNVAAQKIYKKFGFKVLDRRREYYQHPGEDALVMQNDDF
jgi:ribosomal-protein-alanine N-acetyltransferase